MKEMLNDDQLREFVNGKYSDLIKRLARNALVRSEKLAKLETELGHLRNRIGDERRTAREIAARERKLEQREQLLQHEIETLKSRIEELKPVGPTLRGDGRPRGVECESCGERWATKIASEGVEHWACLGCGATWCRRAAS